MTAGTVVITGGILATVILLCIIAVLCYCRLQYYCCKKNGSDTGSISQPHFACNACSAPRLEGAAITPLSLTPEPPPPTTAIQTPRGYCPTCSPYDSPFYIRTTDEMRNGGERITYMPTHYENQALALALPPLHGALMSAGQSLQPAPDFYMNSRAISTEV